MSAAATREADAEEKVVEDRAAIVAVVKVEASDAAATTVAVAADLEETDNYFEATIKNR